MRLTTIIARDEQGDTTEVLYEGAEIPPFGADFEQDGVRYTRVVSAPSVRVKTYDQIIGYTLPRREQAMKSGQTLAKHYDARGRAVFTGRRQIDEYLSASNDNPNNKYKRAWDPDGNE